MSDHDLLTQTLRERSGDMTGHPLDLDQVKGRAHGIQRRRRVMGGAVAAAVLAVAVPVVLGLGDATQDSRPLPVDEPPAPSGPVTADGAAAPRGPDPALPYLTGDVLHLHDGSSFDLGHAYDTVAQYGDGWIGVTHRNDRTYVLEETGEVVEEFPGTGLGVSSDGEWIVTQLEATGGTDLQLREAGADETPLSATVSNGGTVQVVGFAGDQQVVYVETVPTKDGADQGVFVTDFLREPRRLDGLISARGANDVTGVVSGMTSIDEREPGSCSAVVRAASGEQLWETCDFTLDRFSPDGRYVLGIDPYLDGIGGSTVAILDAADGTVLAEYTTRDLGFTGSAVWESDSRVLVSTYQDGRWYLLRLGPDGAVEQARDPVNGVDEMSNPWRFAARP